MTFHPKSPMEHRTLSGKQWAVLVGVILLNLIIFASLISYLLTSDAHTASDLHTHSLADSYAYPDAHLPADAHGDRHANSYHRKRCPHPQPRNSVEQSVASPHHHPLSTQGRRPEHWGDEYGRSDPTAEPLARIEYGL